MAPLIAMGAPIPPPIAQSEHPLPEVLHWEPQKWFLILGKQLPEHQQEQPALKKMLAAKARKANRARTMGSFLT